MDQYLPILTMLVLAAVFAGVSFVASGLLAPRRETVAKSAPYECGIVPSREPAERFPVRFYVVAMVLFAVIVFISLLYEIAMGGLEWGPVKRLQTQVPSASARTTGSTITRVPNDRAA